MYYFYILYSESLDRYYTGHTNDLPERIRKHNSCHKGYTGKACDWKVKYTEKFTTKTEACHRERQVKKRKSKLYIKRLISSAGLPLAYRFFGNKLTLSPLLNDVP